MVWTAPFMINSVFVSLYLIKEVYQFTNVTAFIFIGNWVSHDDEFIYMARFFETEKKAQKTGTNFFKCWFWPGFSRHKVWICNERTSYKIKQQEKNDRYMLCPSHTCKIYVSFSVTDGISEAEAGESMIYACKYSRHRILMFFDILCLGHLADFI